MSSVQESFNEQLSDVLNARGYKPVPQKIKYVNGILKYAGTDDLQQASIFEFTFTKGGEDYGQAWATIYNSEVTVYFDSRQADSPSGRTPGKNYDDSWTGFLTYLGNWAQRRQLNFTLKNTDRKEYDMKQREFKKRKMNEGYHPMGKQASYNDAVPTVKIILQHTRQIQEGEQRFRNVAKIFLENQEGERFLAPTKRPGIAHIYARHLAEGGVPNDERWNHIKSLCEEYNKMAGFVRATRRGEFNESAQALINEGISHYHKLRETLGKMRSVRGYNNYFESWTPALMEEENDESLSDMFVEETLDPRIESVMPILSRLRKNVSEMREVAELEEWADSVANASIVEEAGVAEGSDVTDYDPKSHGGTRKELIARYHETKSPKDAEAARKAGATQQELIDLSSVAESVLQNDISDETIETAGDGLWSDVQKEVKLDRMKVVQLNPKFGELRVYFDTNTWDVETDGLIYTDTAFLNGIKDLLTSKGYDAENIDYSEQGMQGDDYVSFDVDENFLNSTIDETLDADLLDKRGIDASQQYKIAQDREEAKLEGKWLDMFRRAR